MIVNHQPSHETTISNLVQQNSKYYLREVHNHKLYLVAWIKTPQISSYYFTKEDACRKWISHESRVLVELWNELFETSTNSVSSSKFFVKSSHETVKSNLFSGKSGINSCEVPHNEHSYVEQISKSGIFRGLDVCLQRESPRDEEQRPLQEYYQMRLWLCLLTGH